MQDLKGRVIFFSGYYVPFLGGVERYTEKLAHALMATGYEVVIVTSNHDNLPGSQVVDGVQVYRLPILNAFRKRYPIPKFTKSTKKIFQTLRSETLPNYVICNTRFQLTSIIGARWARKSNIRPIVIEHGSSHFSVGVRGLDYLGVLYEHILTLALRRYVKDFYGVSQRCVDWLRHYHIAAKGVFYNSVEGAAIEKFRDSKYMGRWDRDAIVITYAGRIMKEKGVEMLLEAFSTVKAKFPQAVLVIAGDGPYLGEAKQCYEDEQIYFEGRLKYDDVMKLMKSSDIFCYPSMYPEGLPTSILEAGIMECAIIATDRGGVTEVIADQESGIIIAENKDALVSALEQLLGDSSHRAKLKNNIRRRIKENFTWGRTAETVSRVLEDMR